MSKGVSGLQAVLSLIILFILLNFITEGRFLNFLLPQIDKYKKEVVCTIFGFLFQPAYKVGGLLIPIFDADGLVITFLLSLPIFWLLRGRISGYKKVLIYLLIFLTMFFILKFLFYLILVWFGCPEAIERVEVFGITINWSTFNIIFYIGAIVAIIVGIKLFLKGVRSG
ncbi:MAG: hypothetical protein QXG39_00215 [Candidatus Aenigmatarchaeota archaeon]